MKIERVISFISDVVEVIDESGRYIKYTRHDPESWTILMGMSEEPIFEDDLLRRLEAAYQDYRRKLADTLGAIDGHTASFD